MAKTKKAPPEAETDDSLAIGRDVRAAEKGVGAGFMRTLGSLARTLLRAEAYVAIGIAVGCSSRSNPVENCCSFVASGISSVCACADADAGLSVQVSGGQCVVKLVRANTTTTLNGGQPVGMCSGDAGTE